MKLPTYVNRDLRKIETKSIRKGIFATEQHVRDFSFLIDEPEKLGGDNKAPTPLEYVLGSFNGCIQVVIELVARELNFQYDDIDISTVGWVDLRALSGADVSPYYQVVENTIIFYTKETTDRLTELKEVVLQRCPLYNLIKDAGVDFELDWRIK